MPGGMSYEQVQAAVPHSARVISDPPRALDLSLARQLRGHTHLSKIQAVHTADHALIDATAEFIATLR